MLEVATNDTAIPFPATTLSPNALPRTPKARVRVPSPVTAPPRPHSLLIHAEIAGIPLGGEGIRANQAKFRREKLRSVRCDS